MDIPQQLQAFLADHHAGTAVRAYEYLGCHPQNVCGQDGFVFRVWAPNAQSVSVVGDFNFWNPADLPMERLAHGIWQAWSPHPVPGGAYKFLVSHWSGRRVYKADPFAFRTCRMPDTSSVVCGESTFCWHDDAYFAREAVRRPLAFPMNIYELHLGSWRRREDGAPYTYAELAPILADYVKSMGYTHVELMPLTEYPYEPSWGYQVTGYFAPTSRYGTPDELKLLIDTLHAAGIGVILDWVPAHFPKDEYGLYEFDGSCQYEYADPAMNEHRGWGTRIFDFGKPEVRSFLISSAVYFLREFHIDGLRVDAVSAMLYLDYDRPDYRPNRYGGRENLDAIGFLRALNTACTAVRPGAMMIAEESTAFPLVTGQPFDGGLGFTLKWNMGWMNDTLAYFSQDPIYRKFQHEKLTFPMTYAFSERYLLPLSHDEVVYGKGSLIGKMPGDYDQKFANLRLLRGYQMTMPGRKLCFMGGEFGQFTEWNCRQTLDWMLLDYEMHQKLQAYTRALNRFYLENDALWADDDGWGGFRWLQPDDRDSSVIAFTRTGKTGSLLVILNFTPVEREKYRIGVPQPGTYLPVFNSDAPRFGGGGAPIRRAVSEPVPLRDCAQSAEFTVPPLGMVIFRRMSGIEPSVSGVPAV